MSKDFRPQKGFQENALSNSADILVMGGSAGCGKTMTLLMEGARHVRNPDFGSVIFRRTSPQITSEGGLWDTSMRLYTTMNATPIPSKNRWRFPSGSSLKFSHLQYDETVLDWQGSEIPLIGFDELTHFSLKQFNYMRSRNRTSCGVRPYIRATCNPDPDSWVADFISWWIDEETGFPIPERAGKIRYMSSDQDIFLWGDSPEEVIAQAPHLFEDEALKDNDLALADLLKTVSFVPGSIKKDNPLFIAKDPAYLGSLLSLPDAERSQLLDGCWKIRLDGLGLFDYAALKGMFSNYPEAEQRPLKCITVDAARFGRDFCVLMVWKGWEVIHMSVFKKSDTGDVVDHIEHLRRRHNITKMDVVVDQDGVGGDAVKLGGYTGFRGDDPAMKDPKTPTMRKPENYRNLKTQCYYRLADRVNTGGLRLNFMNTTVMIFDDSRVRAADNTAKGYWGTKIKVGNQEKDVRDLVQSDLKAIKRHGLDMEGKMRINTKEEQKTILGRSPDFGDTMMMREFLELKPRPGAIRLYN